MRWLCVLKTVEIVNYKRWYCITSSKTKDDIVCFYEHDNHDDMFYSKFIFPYGNEGKEVKRNIFLQGFDGWSNGLVCVWLSYSCDIEVIKSNAFRTTPYLEEEVKLVGAKKADEDEEIEPLKLCITDIFSLTRR